MKEAARPGEEISIEGLREHRADLWEAAYEELWQVALRSAKRKLPYDSSEQLEDLVSQVVSREIVPQILQPTQKAFEEATTLADILNLTARIISNRAIDEIRRRVRRPDSQDIEKTPENSFASEPSEEGVGEDIHLALDSLEERYRDVIEDFYFEELNTAEIAQKSGRPKGSICSDLAKARQLLGEILSPQLLQSS
ncbi:MAG: sigma-70 family RNA polymerase sigma factor [Verrucomicrobiota bacterium]